MALRDRIHGIRRIGGGDFIAFDAANFTRPANCGNGLRERDQQVDLIAENMPVVLTHIDREQRYVYVNPIWESWYGRKREDVIGVHWRDLNTAETYEKIRPFVESSLLGSQTTFEQRISCPDGCTRDVELRYVPQFDDRGEVRGVFAGQ